jgi:transposase
LTHRSQSCLVTQGCHTIGPPPATVFNRRLHTCLTIEGATDTEVFSLYVEQILLPALRPGDIVVMDNLSPHKSEPTLKKMAEAGVQVLFLPAYSPDLNPIEKMWSKLKAYLRKAEARTREELEQAIAEALKTVTPQDARNWFASCGYSFI